MTSTDLGPTAQPENDTASVVPKMLPYKKQPLPELSWVGTSDATDMPSISDVTAAGPTPANEQSFINALNPNNTLVTSASSSYWTYTGQTARKWGSSTIGSAGGTITYYFAPSSSFTAEEQNTIREGFALWSAETNINFQQTTNGTAANVLLQRGATGSGEYFSDESHVTAGSGSTDGTYNGQTLINFDTTTAGFELTGSFSTYGGYGVGSMVHEMGHLIGLGHGGPYNGSVNPSTDQYSATDSRLWSIMSYIIPFNNQYYSQAKYYTSYPVSGTNWGNATDGSGIIENSTTPMPLDILAAQQIYGAPTGGPLSGGQVFGFHTNIDPSIRKFFDFTVNTKPVVTLFDTGVDNTLDLSGFTSASTVNLNPGTFSSTSGQVNNIGIAYGTVIDHVVGGTGADHFTGTTGAETFTGGGGADTFTGGGGADLYKDTAADLNGDTVTDFIDLDTIDVTDAIGAVTNLAYSGTTLSFMEGLTSVAMTLVGASGIVKQKLDATNGGVDIYFTSPTLAAPVLVSDTGSSASDTITRNDAVTGSADPNATVAFKIDGVMSTQTTTANGSGIYTFTPAGLGDGQHTIVASEIVGSSTVSSAPLTFTLDQTAPSASSPTLTVAQNAGPTAIGIGAPSDNLTTTGALAIVAGNLPADGVVTLSDGTTAVTGGQTLTVQDLQGLKFTPTAGVSNQGSTFTYTVTDTAGNQSTGTAALDVAGPGAPVIANTHGSMTASEAPVTPFTNVTITDPSTAAGAVETLTIALVGAGGALNEGSTYSGPRTLSGGNGSYSLSGTAAAVTAELDALSFKPNAGAPGSTTTTTFVLTDNSSTGASVMDSGTSVADTTPPAIPPSASFSPQVTYRDGVFTLSGHVTGASGIGNVTISATIDDGATTTLGTAVVDANGNFTFSDRVGAHQQSFITATGTNGAGAAVSGQAAYSLTGGLDQGRGYKARQTRYSADGDAETAVDLFKADGSQKANLLASGQTVTSSFFDTFNAHGTPGSTFVFTPDHGLDLVKSFRVDGGDHETLSFSGSDFGNSIATVLQNTSDTKGGALIVDPTTGDAVKLVGITKAQLTANQGDVAFHV